MYALTKISEFIHTVRRGVRTQHKRREAARAKARPPTDPAAPSTTAPQPPPPPTAPAGTCSAFDFLAEVAEAPPPEQAPLPSPPALLSRTLPIPLAAPAFALPEAPALPVTSTEQPALRLRPPTPPRALGPSPVAPPSMPAPKPADPEPPRAPPLESAQLSLLDYTPPPAPPPASTPVIDTSPAPKHALTLEDIAVAVGRTVDGINHRRTSDALELLLTAHKEEIALFTQADRDRNERFVVALLEARTDYREHLERAVTRIIEELADGHTIPAALGQLADQAGAHYRRSERMQEKLLLGLRELTDTMKTHIERIDALLQVAQAKPASEPARLLTLVTPTPASLAASRPAQRSPIDDIPDEDDLDLETHA